MSAGLTAEKEPRQKLSLGILGVIILLLFIVPGLRSSPISR